jgi:hypothetical protein
MTYYQSRLQLVVFEVFWHLILEENIDWMWVLQLPGSRDSATVLESGCDQWHFHSLLAHYCILLPNVKSTSRRNRYIWEDSRGSNINDLKSLRISAREWGFTQKCSFRWFWGPYYCCFSFSKSGENLWDYMSGVKITSKYSTDTWPVPLSSHLPSSLRR